MTKTWLVEISQSGNTIRIEVEANGQRDAMQLAEYRYPPQAGYRVCSAQEAR